MSDVEHPSWSRPPFPTGNRLALVHGATSPTTVAALAVEIEQQARTSKGWPEFLNDPMYGAAVTAWCRAEAVCSLLWRFLAEQDLAAALDEVGTEEVDEHRSKGHTKRSSTSRRTTSALAAWHKAEATAARARTQLGLDPTSRAKLGRNVATTAVQAGLAQLQADGAELVAAARASGALTDGHPITPALPADAVTGDHSGQQETR